MLGACAATADDSCDQIAPFGDTGRADAGLGDAGPGDTWIHDVRQAVRDGGSDLFRPSPVRYWADFLVSLISAYLAASVYLLSPLGSWQQLVAFPIATFWLYRMGSLVRKYLPDFIVLVEDGHGPDDLLHLNLNFDLAVRR